MTVSKRKTAGAHIPSVPEDINITPDACARLCFRTAQYGRHQDAPRKTARAPLPTQASHSVHSRFGGDPFSLMSSMRASALSGLLPLPNATKACARPTSSSSTP